MRDVLTTPVRRSSLPVIALGLAALASCAPHEGLSRRERAERLIAALGACVPVVAQGGQTLDDELIEQELLIGGPEYSFGGPVMTDAMIDCVIDAGGDCRRARACIGLTVELVPGCTDFVRRCDGDTVVGCVDPTGTTGEPPMILRSDCRARGLTCVETTTGGADCGTRACTDADPTVTCEGRVLTSCFEGVQRTGTCRRGELCDAELGGCIGTGRACTTDACDGDVFLPCGTGGRVSTPIDCAALGQRCALFSGGAAACVRPDGSECELGVLAGCEGRAIRYCAPDGRWRTFDCVEHGFAGCSGSHCLPRD